MNRDQIERAVALTRDADTTHEDSRDWYDSYGWHLSTQDAGDVCLQAVEYDWLDDKEDVTAIRNLMRDDDGLTADEAEEIVQRAHEVREAGESICELLDEAVAAYDSGDLEPCRRALLAAYDQESEHGDAPAAQSLAGKLLALTRTTWRVYYAPDGCDPSYCGECDTREEAETLAESEPAGLPRAQWDTARTAGHCAGMTAPDGGEEDEEPASWHGADGWYCVVRVVYSASV